MALHIVLFAGIFVIGEIIINQTAFSYIKNYFRDKRPKKADDNDDKPAQPFLGFDISTFKGILERFVLFYALVLNITQILIVFGTLKIGSRLAAKEKVENDYFIIGNFSSILAAFIYTLTYTLLRPEIDKL